MPFFYACRQAYLFQRAVNKNLIYCNVIIKFDYRALITLWMAKINTVPCVYAKAE
jgi:hypothetical protein